MDKLFIALQYLLPQQLLSRITGWLARQHQPTWLVTQAIKLFISHFGVDMSQANRPYPEAYPSFNAFFTRPLKPGARPVAQNTLVSPADGTISQLGDIDNGHLVQAKGQQFTVRELLGGDEGQADLFTGGQFATIYLSPRDYHRVHMPIAGKLTATTYIPGRLFSVNQVTAQQVERLFARNERLVCYFETELGPMAMILVGAMVVAGIETVWSGQEAPPLRRITNRNFTALPEPVVLDKGDEMGRFMLGSTVILLLPDRKLRLEPELQPGTALQMGQPFGSVG